METKIALLGLILMLVSFQSCLTTQEDPVYNEIQVGVILDMGSWEGKIISSCISMAISDFYAVNPHHRTRIVLQTRDTNGEPLLASSSALDLVENTKVEAIIGPESTIEARFLEVLGKKTNIPILSFSTSPFSDRNPYLLRITQDETIQFKGIASMVESFKWKTVALICEDTTSGREITTYMVNAFQEKNIQVTYTSLVSISATKEQVVKELHKLLAMQSTTFIMHTSPSLSSNLFSNAKKLGMMGEGYIWIVTSKTTNFLDSMDTESLESMQGAVGLKSYIPSSRKLSDFISKWRKEYHSVSPFMRFNDGDFNCIWVYDAVCALAMAVERVELGSKRGDLLLNQILRIKFHGLGGEFKFMNGRIDFNALEIINVIGKGGRRVGFWTGTGEFAKEVGKTNSSSNTGLESINWPGGTVAVLKRKRLQMSVEKLRILVPFVPENIGFKNLIQITVDRGTNLPNVSGFCGDVFNAAFNALEHGVGIEFVPFSFEGGKTYNDLIDKVHLKEFDGAIGDITITANRSHYVDFTLTFTDQGVGTLARNTKKGMWIFLDPLSADLWITSAGFFLVLGFVVWFVEHHTNEEFQGSAMQQIGTTLWFAFSTLVYAHREKLKSNLSRFVVTIWVFVVLVLTSSYTATLSSFLTVQQIASRESSTGFQGLSPIAGAIFNNLKVDDSKFEKLYSPEYYARALTSGRVGAIIDEIPYIKSVLATYSTAEFSMIATASTTNGFGFVSVLTKLLFKTRPGWLNRFTLKWVEKNGPNQCQKPQFLRSR